MFPIGTFARHSVRRPLPETRGNCIERIVKVGPTRRLIDARRRAEGPRFALPPAHWHLGLLNLFPRHALEVIIAGVEFPHMIKAEPLPVARPIAARAAPTGGRCAKLAGFGATRCGTGLLMSMDAAVKAVARTGVSVTHRAAQSKDRL